MKNCLDCENRSTCKKPCDWLNQELKKTEARKEHLTFTDLNIKTDLTADYN